jgi:beta-ketoacyl-acyl-carrier-protein synthase II
MRRVVITGLGTIAPNGNDTQTFWDNTVKGISGAGYITRFDVSQMTSRIGCEIKDFVPRRAGLSEFESLHLDRHVQFAIAAAIEAIGDAQLDPAAIDRERAGVFIGSTNLAPETFETVWAAATNRGAESIVGKTLPEQFYFGLLANAAAASLAVRFGFMGPTAMVSDACSSGVNAIALARRSILEGACDVALAGGTDCPITPMGVDCYCVLGAVSRRNDEPVRASRPFDRDRDGFVIAEGAALLVLEEREHALRRGATIYGEIIGLATNTNAYHMTALPAGGGPLAEVMLTAIKRAGLQPTQVDYINAHGTSTPVNDRSETGAIKAAFGERAYQIPVNSTKCVIGHTQGAASAHQVVVLCRTLRDQILHPTINYENPDPDCDLDYVPNVAREATINVAMANASGFGGINSSIIVARPDFNA